MIERSELLDLLEEWQTEAINEREVHERAESLKDQFDVLPTYEESDARSIALEVLLQLDILNHQLITPEDIPAMRAFLSAPAGQEAAAWAAWKSYWQDLDIERRRKELEENPYYST